MLKRTTILALAAVATIGAALATSTSSADARGFGGFTRGGSPHSMGRIGGIGRIATPNLRLSIRKPAPHWRHHHRHWHVRWHRPWIYAVGTTAIAAPAYAATAKPCTCLTKEYTPDNLVVFKDLCTKEMAAAPLGGPQQQSQAEPGTVSK